MIMICERCFAPIDAGEPVVRLAHLDRAEPDGTVHWVHSFLHHGGCRSPRERPDTGAWDRERGIGSYRT